MAQVACMGELLVDLVSDRDTTLSQAPNFLKAPGGAPANVAVGLAKLGATAAFAGRVGQDAFGDWLKSCLEEQNVNVSLLGQSASLHTMLAFIATRSDGKKDICFYRNCPQSETNSVPEAALFAPADLNKPAWQDTRIFHCGSVWLAETPTCEAQFTAVRAARQRGVLISFDPNWRPSVWDDHRHARELIWEMMRLSDIVKIADEEWEFITETGDFEKGSAAIREAGPRLVVVTRGENGAYFNSAQTSGEVSGFPAQAVDTLGAGDAFVAGLLAEILRHMADDAALEGVLHEEPLREIVRFANACGVLATQTPGAIPSLPTRSEVEEFLVAR